ncbi:hypothetical protein C3F09_12965 [candidate division GN15 bacterium]|uniref:Peptidase S8/S53 domain-containing protein n=1 Tax=candidate division GN15 bacterium TaxID=2072418 RepID=A0A855X1H5_9BACT|nr:MAG: hypothetical protein C3F09_12965 [candidate division GN15 bacterium]
MPHRIWIGMLSLIQAASAVAQDTLFFHGFKGREYFVLSSQSVTVRLTDTSWTPEILAGDYPELILTDKPDRMGLRVFAVQVRGSVNTDSLLTRLNGDDRIEFAIRGAVSRGGSEVFLDNSISIFLQSSSTRSVAEAALTKLHLAVKPMQENHPEFVAAVLQRSDLTNYRQILDTVGKLDPIRCVVPTFWSRYSLLSAPNDPWWSEQQHLWADKLNLEHAFDFALRTDSVSIHFFDDGVAIHEDFPQPFSITGYNWADERPQFTMGPYSKHAMGTTGVAYAKINNALGIAGYNNANFKVHVQQILVTGTDSTSYYRATDLNIYLAMVDAAQDGADIINHSWGYPQCDYDDPGGYIAAGLDTVYKLGVLTVAGAGNCRDDSLGCACVILPARGSHVLAVGGLNMGTNYRDVETSYGPELDVTTYSRDIPTLSLMGAKVFSNHTVSVVPSCDLLPVNYRCMTGTSISSPQAAAIAGLVLAKRPDFKNHPDTLSMILRYSTDDGAAPCALDTIRHDDEISYGRLDAYRALHAVSRGNVNNAGIIDLSDLTYLSSYLADNGPAPIPDMYIGDLNCDCQVTLADLSALVTYLTTPNATIALCFRFHN